MPNYEAVTEAIADWVASQRVDHTQHHSPEGGPGCLALESYTSQQARDVATILKQHGVSICSAPPAPEKPTEGWQKFMAQGQRVAHYIRDTESLCGRLMFYTSELVADGLDAVVAEGDCATCKRKVAAEIAKREAGK